MSTNERNIELCAKYQAALAVDDRKEGRKYAEAILRENEGLSKTLGFRYARPQNEADKDDILQAAKMGLLRAAKDFDPTKGTFSTHAAWHVRDYVQRWTGKTSAVVRPKSAKMPAAIAKAASMFRLKNGCEPSAVDLGITQEQLDEWSSATHFVEVDDVDEERPNLELTYDEEADTQTRVMQLEAAWENEISNLSERNRDIAHRVLMKGESTVEVAKSHGLVHSRVIQVCKRIEVRLKRALNPATYDPDEDYDRKAAARTAAWRARRRASALGMAAA